MGSFFLFSKAVTEYTLKESKPKFYYRSFYTQVREIK